MMRRGKLWNYIYIHCKTFQMKSMARAVYIYIYIYSRPSIVRPPLYPTKFGLSKEVVCHKR